MNRFEEFAAKATEAGIAIYSARIKSAGNGFHIEIELDGMDDPNGAVNLSQCQGFSSRFIEMFDAILDEGISSTDELSAEIPEGLNAENYSLEVASAGAERKLRLPEDLFRFQGSPLKLRIKKEENGSQVSELAVFKYEENGSYFFESYIPRRRKGGGKKQVQFQLKAEELLQANLYLDF